MTEALRRRDPHAARSAAVRRGRDWLGSVRVHWIAVSVTGALGLVWLIFLGGFGTDLSAQVAWAHFAGTDPLAAYDFSWYGGVYPAAYSVLAPYVLSVVGPRLGMVLASLGCAALMALLLERHDVPRPRVAAAWLGIALWFGMIAGRATFTLGLIAAIAAVYVLDAHRPGRVLRCAAGAACALVCTLLSPVAGAFVGIAAAALIVTGRRIEGLTLGAAAGAPLIVLAVAFGSGGVQPISIVSTGPSILAAVCLATLAPKAWRAVRVGAVIYAAAVLLAWIVPTPLGSNVDRLGLLLAGPLLISVFDRRRRGLLAALAAVAVWQLLQPARDLASGPTPATGPADTGALLQRLEALHADTARVEAVPQYGHWESAALAAVVPLARGWERQVDNARNPLFYQGALTPERYHAWLRDNAVRYVAISTARPDYAAQVEAAIVRAGQPWLVPVWHDTEWSLFRVVGTAPLASGPARVLRTSPTHLTLVVRTPGNSLVRVRWSPLLTVTPGASLRAHGDWTLLQARHPGHYTISASY